MLYLLRSFIRGGTILKAGFAEVYESRLGQYIAHNPGIEEIAKREGTLIDERRLHLYLRFLGYRTYKDEWYFDNPEVISAFHEDFDKINEVLWKNGEQIFKDLSFRNEFVPDFVIISELLEKFSDDEQINTKLRRRVLNIEEIWRLQNLDLDSVVDDELRNLYQVFKTTGNFEIRMKAVCELYSKSPDKLIEASSIICPVYMDYIDLLGYERIRSVGYREADIKNLFIGASHSDQINNLICSTFAVGGKYTLVDIKAALKEIYDRLDISKSPKASEIKNYFDVSDFQVTDKVTGKRIHGFEIIRRR